MWNTTEQELQPFMHPKAKQENPLNSQTKPNRQSQRNFMPTGRYLVTILLALHSQNSSNLPRQACVGATLIAFGWLRRRSETRDITFSSPTPNKGRSNEAQRQKAELIWQNKSRLLASTTWSSKPLTSSLARQRDATLRLSLTLGEHFGSFFTLKPLNFD